MQIAEFYKEVIASCLFRWRHTFRAFLWHGGICSEPTIDEAIVSWGRPGEETCKNAGWKLICPVYDVRFAICSSW